MMVNGKGEGVIWYQWPYSQQYIMDYVQSAHIHPFMILNSITIFCQEFEQTLPMVARNETHDRKDDILW